MTLDQVTKAVRASAKEDWNRIAYGRGQQSLYTRQHPYIACYVPDVSITMGWGMKFTDNFDEPWARDFPDPMAFGEFVDVFYNGGLVFRNSYVVVDGGRACLPFPASRGDLTVTRDDYDLIRIVHELTQAIPFEEYFTRAKFQIQG